MALRTVEDWEAWLSDIIPNEDACTQYATELVDAYITEYDLSELNHEMLIEMTVSKLGYRTKILKKARTAGESEATSAKMIKSDVKLPHISMNSSPSQFRKFLIDWNIYKSEHQISGLKCNKLLYSSCDEMLQNSIINGLPEFLETSEDKLMLYIKNAATKLSNPTVYRLAFQRLDQGEHQGIDNYIDILRDKAIDCEFVCPSESCHFDYSEYAIRDRFIQGLLDKKTQTNILTNISTLPTLNDVIKHAKSMEAARHDVSTMDNVLQKEDEYSIHAARKSSYKKASRNNAMTQNSQHSDEPCTGCGKTGHSSYAARKSSCPAWGKTCNSCGIRNHFATVCKRKPSETLALIAQAQDKAKPQDSSDMLWLQAAPIINKSRTKYLKLEVFPDSGANICLAGSMHMQQLKLSHQHLQHSGRTVATAGGFRLQSFGWCYISFTINSAETVQPVHFCHQVSRLYLSKVACIELKLLPPNFPHSNLPAILESKSAMINKVVEIRHSPPQPDEIPFSPVEKNIPKLELYLKEAFSSSTFNSSPPFPAMANTTPAKIHIKPGAEPDPKHVPIPIALHWQDIIKKQLDDDVAKGVIEVVPVGEPIKWCSQMVIVQKKDGSLRRTVNYQRLNSQCDRETHHCQPPFMLATQIPPNVKKTVFDAVDGYHVIPLHKDSKHYTTFITPWGAYRYCHLPQGFVASADAYTRRYDDLIANFPRKVKCIDDVLLWDNDIKSSFFRAWEFLSFCANNGIVLSKKKFKFCQDNVEFAGLQILQNGIAPSKKILQAIEEFPTPTSLTDARSWFGLVNQVAWAHSDSSTMTPFRELIKPNTPFYWDDNLERIFTTSKEHLIKLVKHGVRNFDTSKPTCIQTDWSQQGIGFLLMQKHCGCPVDTKIDPKCCKSGWKLTYAGSRFTTDAETRYSPTEGEALAVAWSLHKSKFFTLGCKNLTIATDH